MADKTIGFWKSSDNCGYLSSPIGYVGEKPVRMRLIKNRYASKERNTPSYIAFFDENCAFDKQYSNKERRPYYDSEYECYNDENGNRLYTREEVQHCINCAAADGARGYSGYGDNIVEDYI